MISAFGVDHGGFSKSLVNGVFKPANKLSGAERQVVGGYKKARGVSTADREFKEADKATRDLHDSLNSTHHLGVHRKGSKDTKAGQVHTYEHNILSGAMPPGAAGLHLRVGGKKGTSYVHLRSDGAKSTEKHELAHASPKRTGYRMAQAIKDPEKLMREEARADFVARGHYNTKKPSKLSGYGQAARARGSQVAGEKNEKGLKKPVARLMNTSIRNQASANTTHLEEALHKPNMGSKPVDEYRNVHDQMYRAKYKKEPPTSSTASRHAGKITAGVVGATGAAGADVAYHQRRKFNAVTPKRD